MAKVNAIIVISLIVTQIIFLATNERHSPLSPPTSEEGLSSPPSELSSGSQPSSPDIKMTDDVSMPQKT